MAARNKFQPLLAGMALLCYPGYLLADFPLSQGETEFNATILQGSCDWIWNETVLNFLPVTTDNIKPETTLEIKPLTAAIQCNLPLTPQLKITGNTPFSGNNNIFLDGSNTRSLGFMLQVDDGSLQAPSLASFYRDGMAGKAMTNNIPVNLPTRTQANPPSQQIIWVGLVGMDAGPLKIPGSFSTTLTFTGLIP